MASVARAPRAALAAATLSRPSPIRQLMMTAPPARALRARGHPHRRLSVAVASSQSFHDFSATGPATPKANGPSIALSKYAGKVVLVENVATL